MIFYVFPNWWFLFVSMPHEVNLSFSGASVFFFTPYRVDGTPMPASVMKFDQKECGMAPEEGDDWLGLQGSTDSTVNRAVDWFANEIVNGITHAVVELISDNFFDGNFHALCHPCGDDLATASAWYEPLLLNLVD